MNLKETLQTKGLKQDWLADKLGVTRATVSRWVNGHTVPHTTNLVKISELLNVEIKDLIK